MTKSTSGWKDQAKALSKNDFLTVQPSIHHAGMDRLLFLLTIEHVQVELL